MTTHAYRVPEFRTLEFPPDDVERIETVIGSVEKELQLLSNAHEEELKILFVNEGLHDAHARLTHLRKFLAAFPQGYPSIEKPLP